MSKVITVANIKGGVGKSTIAFNLAVEFTYSGKKTLLIDADTQNTSAEIHAVRSESDSLPQFSCIVMNTPVIHKEVSNFRDFDIVIIDAGGRDSKIFRSAVLASDTTLIPLKPSQVDVDSTHLTIQFLDEARTIKEINGFLVINQAVTGTKAEHEVREILSKVKEDFDVEILTSVLHNRISFSRSLEEGKGVSEFEPAGKAAEEMKCLFCLL